MREREASYAESIREVESIVARMENGDLDVDDLLDAVKRASALINQCRIRLRSTEESLVDPLAKLAVESAGAEVIAEEAEVSVVSGAFVLDEIE